MPDKKKRATGQHSHQVGFSSIARAARTYWTILYRAFGLNHMCGRVVWAGRITVWAELTFMPSRHLIVMRARLAELPGMCSPRVAAQLFAVNSRHLGTGAVWDSDTGAVLAQAACRCPWRDDEVDDTVRFLFRNFSSLLNDERLFAVLASCGARLCGTDLDQWGADED